MESFNTSAWRDSSHLAKVPSLILFSYVEPLSGEPNNLIYQEVLLGPFKILGSLYYKMMPWVRRGTKNYDIKDINFLWAGEFVSSFLALWRWTEALLCLP